MKNVRTIAALLLCGTCIAAWALDVAGSNPSTATGQTSLENISDNDLHISYSGTATNGVWIHPGLRNLDPVAFGTVGDPRGAEFMIGVPLYDRLDDGNGNWTTTATPTPASNNTTQLSDDATVSIWCEDRTPVDLQTFTSPTKDRLRIEVVFTDPYGRKIEIRSTKPLPKGPFHEFWGGVGSNHIMHGRTGLGGKLMPQVFAYGLTFSLASILIDGQLLPGNDNRLVHTMITQGVRDASNDPGAAGGSGPFLGNQTEVDREDLEIHVVCPPVRFIPGPQPNAPVVGFPQEFIHLLFEDVVLSGNTINGVLRR